jgi:O-antigen ligase
MAASPPATGSQIMPQSTTASVYHRNNPRSSTEILAYPKEAGLAPVSGFRVTFIGMLCFVVGSLQFMKINVGGELFGAEIALPIAALAALMSRKELQLFSSQPLRVLLACLALTLLGYVISDLAAGTPSEFYIKGWGRIAVLTIDVVCLVIILSQDRRNLWWLVAGLGLGGVLFLRLVYGMSISMWKFYYAEPMVLIAATAGALIDRRLAAAWFVLLGYYSFTHDFRTFGGFNLLFAAAALASGDWTKARAAFRPDRARALKAFVAVAIAILAAKYALDEFGGDYWAHRRAASDVGRAVALEIGIEAVKRSPVLGYGSWMRDKELAALQSKRMEEQTGWPDRDAKNDRFHPHSQVLQAWAEGGIVGAALFFLLVVRLPGLLLWLFTKRPPDALTYIYSYYLVTGTWNIFNSPFSAPLRLSLAMLAVCTVVLAVERSNSSRQTRTRHVHLPYSPHDKSGQP